MPAEPTPAAESVFTAEMLERCVDPTLPPGVIEIAGFRYPLIEFVEERHSDGLGAISGAQRDGGDIGG